MTSPSRSRKPYLRRIFSIQYLLEPVEPTYGDIALLICCYCSGLLDAAAFDNWSVFIGMQTGNSVLLGLSTASLPRNSPFLWAKTLLVIGSFMLGSLTAFLFFRFTSRGEKLRRLHIVVSFSVQTLLLILAGALCSTSVVPQDPLGKGYILDNNRILSALPPLAFQSGMQIATGNILGFGELPTLVLTSVYAGLTSDIAAFQLKNRKRDRRIAAIILLLGGAISSGWLMRAGTGVYGVIWITVGLKVLITVGMWLALKGIDRASDPTEKA